MVPWDVGPGGDSIEGGLPHQEAHRKRGRSQVPTPLATFCFKKAGRREPVGRFLGDHGGPMTHLGLIGDPHHHFMTHESK